MENALKLCKHLFSALTDNPCEGEITYIDRYEIDVDSSIGIVRLFSDGILRPYSCLVSPTMNFSSLPIVPGMKIFLGPEEIDINDADIAISLKMAEKVDLSAGCLGLFIPMDLKQRLRYLQRAIELNDEKGCFADILLDPSVSIPYNMDKRLHELTEAIRNENPNKIRSAAKECSGLGDGRLPASDNLLCGYMLAFTAFGFSMGRKWENVQSINGALLEGAAANTTRESAFILWLASYGLADEEGCRLFRCLFSDKPYPGLLAAANASAKQNGNDWLAGIIVFLLNYAY